MEGRKRKKRKERKRKRKRGKEKRKEKEKKRGKDANWASWVTRPAPGQITVARKVWH